MGGGLMPKQYLDNNGNPIQAPQSKVYLDDNGNPVGQDPKAAFMAQIEQARQNMAAQAPALDRAEHPEKGIIGKTWDFLTQPIGSSPMDVAAGMRAHVANLGGGGQVAAYKQAQGNATPGQIITNYSTSAPTAEESKNPVLTGIKKGGASALRDVYDTQMAAYSPIGMATPPAVMGREAVANVLSKGGEKVVDAASPIFGSTRLGGEKLNEVMEAAKDVPVDPEKLAQVAARAKELWAAGNGAPPAPIKMFLRRLAQQDELGPITYKELRDFAQASNFKNLSIQDVQTISKPMKAQLRQFASAAWNAGRDAAESVGQADNYVEGLKLYGQAERNKATLGRVVKYGAPIIGGGTALYYGRGIADMLKR